MSVGPVRPGGDVKTIIAACLLTAALGVVDWITGYRLSFFVFYFFTVAWAASRARPEAAFGIAILSAGVWAVADHAAGHSYISHAHAVWNTMVRLLAFLIVAWVVHRARVALVGEQAARRELERTLSELRVLRGLVSICAQCKKIRGEDGAWLPVEKYVSEHTHARFSHGYCPGCAHQVLVEAGLAEAGTGHEG